MSKRILITGGAGFIGSHLADELLAHGYEVRVLDILTPQVHGTPNRSMTGVVPRPPYLADTVELQVGDVCDPLAVRRALRGVDAVFHLAAAVGVGQSMYEIAHYTRTNNLGTAVLLQTLLECPVERLIVASSMSIYGEGLYARPRIIGGAQGANQRDTAYLPVHGTSARSRSLERLKAGDWEIRDIDGVPLIPLPTPESHASATGLQSIYALSKFDQERLCLITGRAYGIPSVALRFFNVYGPRQALSNPYTGVMAIFASRLLNGKPPLINEDGLQQRDFVHVRDIARACLLALEMPMARLTQEGEPVFNIGSGEPRTIREVAQRLSAVLGRDIAPEITGTYRMGDIRHCFADISKARTVLGYAAGTSFDDGLRGLVAWLESQIAKAPNGFPLVTECAEAARSELAARGLAIAASTDRGSEEAAMSAEDSELAVPSGAHELALGGRERVTL